MAKTFKTVILDEPRLPLCSGCLFETTKGMCFTMEESCCAIEEKLGLQLGSVIFVRIENV